MLHERLQEILEGLNGVVLIDIDDAFMGIWDRQCPDYLLLEVLGKVAKAKGIPIFIDKNLDGIGGMEDYERRGKEDLTADWVDINRCNYERAAEGIERTLRIPREQTFLGFGGTYADACVRRFLYALCEEKIIPEVQRDSQIVPLTENPIARPFQRGKLLYELTDNRSASLFFDRTIVGPLEEECRKRFGPSDAY